MFNCVRLSFLCWALVDFEFSNQNLNLCDNGRVQNFSNIKAMSLAAPGSVDNGFFFFDMAAGQLTPFDPSTYDPVEPIRFVVYVFKICGLWPVRNKFRNLYLVYTFFFQLTFTLAFITFKYLNFYYKTHMDMATIIIFETLAEISMAIRGANFIAKFDDIYGCLSTIKLFKCENMEELELYKKRQAMFTRVLRFYFSCASFACFFSLSAPFFADKPMLAYPAYYPYLDWKNNRMHFWIAYMYQLVGILILAHTLILLEAYHIYLMITIGAQLDILAIRLRNIKRDTSDLPDAIKDDKTVTYFLDTFKSFEIISG